LIPISGHLASTEDGYSLSVLGCMWYRIVFTS